MPTYGSNNLGFFETSGKLDFRNNYFDRFFSDWVFIKNKSNKIIKVIDKNGSGYLIDKNDTGSCQVVEGGVNVDSWCRFWRTVEDLVVFNHQYTIHPGIGETLETEDKVDIKVIPSKKEVET